jgi:hypothetical protein
MSDIYILWRTCYAHEGQTYSDYLVWLAATWVDYADIVEVGDATLCGDPTIRWGFIAYVRGKVAGATAEALAA